MIDLKAMIAWDIYGELDELVHLHGPAADQRTDQLFEQLFQLGTPYVVPDDVCDNADGETWHQLAGAMPVFRGLAQS
jgi:hypothetical protein